MAVSVLVYVQHLLGIGHLARASLVAEALHRAGLRVSLVTGGPPVADYPPAAVQTIALPPLKAGPGGFSDLVDLAGAPASQSYLAARRARLLEAFETRRPDIVVIEAYPFGRRQMRFELEPLLERTRTAEWAPLVACSLRDIVQENRKPGRDRETVEVLRRSFDMVLVHGDPALIGLEASFPLARDIASLIRYTGLVSRQPGALEGPRFDVVVSAGGGAAGAALLDAARGAIGLSALRAAGWAFLTGPNAPAEAVARLAAGLPDNAVVEAYRRDFRALLAAAQLSVSQAGYNTAADVLGAGCRAVMVPFAAGGESEQSRRAAALAERGLAQVVAESDLSPATLARAIDAAIASAAPGPAAVRLDGAERTPALLIAGLHAKRG